MTDAPSYHDLHITTAELPRTSIFDLPYGLKVTCTRVAGWELWDYDQMRRVPGLPGLPEQPTRVAGEFETEGLRLDVAGHVIVDSLSAGLGETTPTKEDG